MKSFRWLIFQVCCNFYSHIHFNKYSCFFWTRSMSFEKRKTKNSELLSQNNYIIRFCIGICIDFLLLEEKQQNGKPSRLSAVYQLNTHASGPEISAMIDFLLFPSITYVYINRTTVNFVHFSLSWLHQYCARLMYHLYCNIWTLNSTYCVL